MKLNVKKYCIGISIIWSLYILSIGWLTAAGFGSQSIVNFFSVAFVGFSASFSGAIIGALWGLVYGFIGGFILVNLYNKMFSKNSPNR